MVRCLTGLTVGENAGIVTLERIVQNVATQGVEHHILIRKVFHGRVQGIETMIEREGFRLAPVTTRKGMPFVSTFGKNLLRT